MSIFPQVGLVWGTGPSYLELACPGPCLLAHDSSAPGSAHCSPGVALVVPGNTLVPESGAGRCAVPTLTLARTLERCPGCRPMDGQTWGPPGGREGGRGGAVFTALRAPRKVLPLSLPPGTGGTSEGPGHRVGGGSCPGLAVSEAWLPRSPPPSTRPSVSKAQLGSPCTALGEVLLESLGT